MPENTPLLSVRDLKKTYQGASGPVEAIGSISFDVRPGELVCIVGPSGCGKTTLLKCLSGLLPPTAGSVTLDGAEVTAPPKKMAVVFQEYGRSLYPWLTVRDNVGLPLKARGVPRRERLAAVERALAEVGLGHALDTYPWQLSGGMQQRVAIARAVAYEPEILVMDEPFAAVDAQTRADLEDLVRRVWQDLGVTVLFVTHDIDESVYLGERVLMLSSSPTVVQQDLAIDLPAARDQLTTRAMPRFTALRTQVYEQIQRAKRGETVAATS
ncbi:ABC transporter ATP-binding protein [Cellulomonas xiejunii]|uniref:ABC transporter ATP-binding protein n=1 Tax=Cellulomonas xiejunii TaxID=2968083 RepID=A0ABY5KP04_9CELL|nr:ABC transporter ATP-binding protein [Cellulomonas xiejunii]MCC2322173.1 ABC transporter ATP-binding protein [Cellulomonas xiejunii]MCC2323184.1 ABC transporter ATP-binding protein [Cellulomonas xiejunii]UUI72227.1 ABC transporter ATP-binding protein [Cellulomonas xiejunii]